MTRPSHRRFADADALAAYLRPGGAPSLVVAHEFVPGLPGVVLKLELGRWPAGFTVFVDYTSWVLQDWGEVNHRMTYEFTTLEDALAYLRCRFARGPQDIAVPGGPATKLDLEAPPEQGDYQEAWHRLGTQLESLLRAEAETGDRAAWERLAGFLHHRGGGLEAAQIRLRLLAERPLPEDPEEHARALEHRADLELRAHDFTAALADLEILCQLEPDDEGHRALRIRCLHRADRHAEVVAASTVEIARLTASPPAELAELRLAEAIRTRGEARYWLGDKSGAQLDYEAATRINPDDAGAWADLAELHLEHGFIDAAAACIERAWEIGGGALGGFVQLVRGDVYAARGDFDEARAWWDAAVSCGSERAQERLQRHDPGE
jgi:tetratricopeptide (TPR) repeat protein